MKVIGLTGGIGMGKSTAAKQFRRAHIPMFDADAEVHRLQARGGAAVAAIDAAFPGTIRDGAVDRSLLRAKLIAEPAGWRVLEQIIHPLVRAARRAFLARCRRQGVRIAVLDIPLLFETGPNPDIDLTMVVSTSTANQTSRLRKRGRMTEVEIAAIIARQMPDSEKRRRADLVIRTGLSRRHAQARIARLIQELRR
ncbi:dephospho-CoA kinase [Acidisoma cellulosilytica]|uniref:Dephospho-CoA kinase n=1 Tax=Acidisoma cellulosilyticum TaxID=2802395 RepID=A0A963YXR5_9PROT|nr:dephospho-CoA kinase [Acidisoma cellulosilyticum]MCB8879096.1 dephospho-CoA kinase [Acidisoma cellulosilyticum]